MKLKPFARLFSDQVYRLTYFVICSPRQAFVPEFTKLLKTTDLSPKGRQGVLDALLASDGARVDDCTGRCFRLTPDDGQNQLPMAVIWLLPGESVSVLTHEAWHAVFWVFRERGVSFEDGYGADEPVAYYLDFLIRKALGA